MDALSPKTRATLPQVLLGVFVAWQLCFLIASNLITFFPNGQPEAGELSDSRRTPFAGAEPGPAQHILDAVGCLSERYEKLTGQTQAWWLFSPSFPPAATFPVVELRWDDPDHKVDSATAGLPCPPVRLHSVVEPQDVRSYWRPPGSFDRLFHYENRLAMQFSYWDEHAREAPNYQIWNEAMTRMTYRQWKSIRAYLLWRVGQYQQLHAELPPPRQALLIVRVYWTPPAGDQESSRPAPLEKTLARWRPTAAESPEFLPIELCDARADTFLRLPRTE